MKLSLIACLALRAFAQGDSGQIVGRLQF